MKYAEIEHNEDLGLGYPPADDTDDLVGVTKENGPGSCANSSEANSSHLTKGESL